MSIHLILTKGTVAYGKGLTLRKRGLPPFWTLGGEDSGFVADLTRQILSRCSCVFGGMGGRKLMGNGPPDLPESLRRREPQMEAGNHDSLADQLMELHSLQEARIAAEEEARFRAAEDARRRAEAAGQQRREEEEARLQAAEEARLAEERAQRDEAERRVRAGKDAELRVQLQEGAKARAAEQQRMLEHEKEIAAITAVEKAKIRVRRMLIGGLAFVVIGSAAGYAFGVKPALERKALEAESARQAQQLALEDKKRAEEDLVDAQLRAEQAEEDKEAFEQKVEARELRQKEREQRVKDRPKQRPKAKAKGCAPDDPLCGIKID